jgi:4-oxalocrotonate tautomerase family enzyme
MPYIQCNIQSGLSAETKRQLALELTRAVHESLGSPIQYIHVAVTETPTGQFVESGQIDLAYGSANRATQRAKS